MIDRLQYWRRIAKAYLLSGNSNLTFWHERPAVHDRAAYAELGPYYMSFSDKSSYPGPFDAQGVPQLDYHGTIGRQYNPIAISQYGLAHFNLMCEGRSESRAKMLIQADWLVDNLVENAHGVPVWQHHFDFDYRETLRAPWYSGLAQGQGLSLLARAYKTTGDERYRRAMRNAFRSLTLETSQGGVRHTDSGGSVWIEEYIVQPPTHILNGFIWALWGVWDYARAEGDLEASDLFAACIRTIEHNLPKYDTGLWSKYELSGTRLPMIASPFYHQLHIVQLRVLGRMTGLPVFGRYADRWAGYSARRLNRSVSLAQKCAFKVLYY